MTEARERDLEHHARVEGQKRVRKQIERAAEKGRGADTPGGVDLIRQGIAPLTEAVRQFVEEARAGKAGRLMTAVPLIEQVSPEVAAYFALKAAINAISGRSRAATLTATAINIGAMVEEELRLCAFEGTEPALYNTIRRQLEERGAGSGHAGRVFVFAANKAKLELPTLTKTEKLHLGTKLVDLFITVTGFIKVTTVRNGAKTRAVIQPTDKVREWLAHRNRVAELLHPQYMPTVIPPRDWGGAFGGGYHHTCELRSLPLVKRASKAQMALLDKADMGPVIAGLNAIQRTGWRVNRRILELMEHAWDNGLDIAMPTEEGLPLPPKPAKFRDLPGEEAWRDVTPEDRKQWKRDARAVHEANAQSIGRRMGIRQIIATARAMADDPVIYFPHQLDFRGRAYAVPVGLNPQGSDHAKALLTFAEGKPINEPRAAGWLAIHGANLFGYDKANLEERIAWVQEREERIIATAAEPLADMWWTEADNPWSFLAWCFEYAAFVQHGYGFVSSLPISVDGSCNGLQHFSAMLRDPVGGAAVNLIPGDKPADIYQRVADRVTEKLTTVRADPTTADPTEDWLAYGWLHFGIDRTVTKRPVMVLPYGGTFASCLDYVRDAVNEKIAGGKENPFGDELRPATSYLAKHVWASISDVVVAARVAMNWLQKVARVATAAGLPLTWTTPAGFPAYQAYRSVKMRKVETRLQGSILRPLLPEETPALDPSRQALGISPNFVHSMDAAAMMLTIAQAVDAGVSQFAMIHDSYGTTAADMDTLAAFLRLAFVEMYRDHNVLAEFLAGFPEEVRTKCPPVPEMGTLDLELILGSEFFFA